MSEEKEGERLESGEFYWRGKTLHEYVWIAGYSLINVLDDQSESIVLKYSIYTTTTAKIGKNSDGMVTRGFGPTYCLHINFFY